MRPARLWAIARQDWAIELAGRQGWILPGLLASLLLGPSAAPEVRLGPEGWRAEGEVPPAVAALPQAPEGAVLGFVRDGDRVVVVGSPPPEVRAALDGLAPAIRRVEHGAPPRLPGRTALFGLISASTLSSAVASSIGGERSRKTLGVLLAAAVSREEIVFGKALAWSLFGLVAVVGAAVVSLVLGRVDPGWWLLPLPTVPIATVGLGFLMVRRATDVVAGTATAMRVLPAVVSVGGIAALLLGFRSPILGALVPVGGALVASGDAWEGPLPAVLATISTGAFAVGCLLLTVRDLEEHPSEEQSANPWVDAAIVAALAGPCWWVPVATPLLYAPAGNAAIADGLPLSGGVLAGVACLAMGTLVRLARDPAADPRAGLPAAWAWGAGLAVGALLALLALAPPPTLGPPALAARLADARHVGPALGALGILADEVLFRGWLQSRTGPLASGVVAFLVKTPLDPVGGAIEAAALAGLSQAARSIWPGVLARLAWLAVALLAG